MIIKRTEQRHNGKRNRLYAFADCPHCGNEISGMKNTIEKQQRCRSCMAKITNTKHGMANARVYHIWQGIKSRCNCDTDTGYKDYGARGIKVCSEWSDPKVFITWALASGYNDDLSIERLNYNGDYTPSNCTWIPIKDQAYNKGTNSRNKTGHIGISEYKYGYVSEVSNYGKRWRKKFKTLEEAIKFREDVIILNNLQNQFTQG